MNTSIGKLINNNYNGALAVGSAGSAFTFSTSVEGAPIVTESRTTTQEYSKQGGATYSSSAARTTGQQYISSNQIGGSGVINHKLSGTTISNGLEISGQKYVSSGNQYVSSALTGNHKNITGQTYTGQTITGQTTAMSGSYTTGSRIVTGEERVVGYNTIQQEDRIISERIVEHEVRVPKRIVREEVIEKVIVVPETITREEVIEEIQMVKETIIEVAKPVIQEKIVEVPEIEYRDKIVEKIERVVQEKLVEVPRIEYQERVVEVPKIIYQEKIVEVPEIEYRDVVVERVVEVQEIRENVVVREVPVPQYVDKPMPEYVNVEQPYDVDRNIPVPVEAITTFEYQLAQFRPRVNKVTYPLYVPRFVEVPVSAELFDASMLATLNAQGSKLKVLSSTQAVGLCEIENMAADFRRTDISSFQSSGLDLQTAITNAWKSGQITMRGNPTMGTTTMGTGYATTGYSTTVHPQRAISTHASIRN